VGENGFGYDPIFYYPPMGMSTAEMPSEEKNKVSHRANALNVFYEKLKEAGYADK
jgi:XTP/dITP diphosphohydrolase